MEMLFVSDRILPSSVRRVCHSAAWVQETYLKSRDTVIHIQRRRKKDKYTYRKKIDRQKDRHTGRKTDGCMDRQTVRQSERQTDR